MARVYRQLRSWLRFLRWKTTGIQPNRSPVANWDREYASGSWAFLGELRELGHYSVIVGYAQAVEARNILDVCCGHGVLTGHLKRLPYESYLGIDLSAEAIRQATERHGDARTSFAAGDAKSFQTERRFDLILFNECLYYLGDPRERLRQYAQWLMPGGHIVVSMYHAPENRAVWHEALKDFPADDTTVVRHPESGLSWTIRLLSPGSRSAGAS